MVKRQERIAIFRRQRKSPFDERWWLRVVEDRASKQRLHHIASVICCSSQLVVPNINGDHSLTSRREKGLQSRKLIASIESPIQAVLGYVLFVALGIIFPGVRRMLYIFSGERVTDGIDQVGTLFPCCGIDV